MGNMLACQPKRGHSINRHLQKFTRQSSPSHFHTSTLSHPHTHTFSLNERIVVSREDGKAWAIAMGTVTMATDGEIELLLDKLVATVLVSPHPEPKGHYIIIDGFPVYFWLLQ